VRGRARDGSAWLG